MKPTIASEYNLLNYSPYSFVRKINPDTLQKLVLQSYEQNTVAEIALDDTVITFIYSKQNWESAFFERPIYKLINVLYSEIRFETLVKSIALFEKEYITEPNSLLSAEVPSEDVNLIQALGENRFKLIESRLTYFIDKLSTFNYKRFEVRQAESKDIGLLMNVATAMRNDFDRYHADLSIDNEIADKYLATYIKNSVEGFTDYVMVPGDTNGSNEAFLTANYLKSEHDNLGVNIAKMVLSAVSPNCKGWYVKLISEMTYHLAKQNAEVVFMNTQSTNKAVIKTWESLGYHYGKCVHIFSKNCN
jgi:dTDP-4-amino-4,6-dideoxy-D-galactose acyltransferase